MKVMHEEIGIVHGCMTTIHDITNTQTIVDKGHKDLRRARACGQSLIPTTTGSAKAITKIFPELTGQAERAGGARAPAQCLADRLRVRGARGPYVEEVNGYFKEAAEGELKGILGYEERPLVSVDYARRSALVHRRCALHHGHRRHPGEGAGLVRQRVGLREPHDGAGPQDGSDALTVDTYLRNYLTVTGGYWAFTITDGAIRMLVVLYFHILGYSPFEVAMLFLFYEFFGMVTNLVGGWLGARHRAQSHHAHGHGIAGGRALACSRCRTPGSRCPM